MNTTKQQAVMILKMLGMRYAPRPMPWNDTSQPQETADQITEMFVNMLTQYDHEAVLAASERICQENPEWSPNLNQYLQVIQVEARRVLAERTRYRALSERTVCEGSGMVETADGFRPCATCNPFLYEEWQNGNFGDADPASRQRARDWMERNGGMPSPCGSNPYETAKPIPASEGVAIAKAAYVEEIERLNKEHPLFDKQGNPKPRIPNLAKFDGFLAMVDSVIQKADSV